MDELASRDISADEGELRTTITMLARNVLGAEEERFVGTGTAAAARTALTRVMAVGIAAMVLAGALAVVMSGDRRRQIRGLAVRVAVSAATFAVVLRVGAWAVDPSGGRSPLAAGGAVVLGAKGHVPAFVAAVATVAAALASVAVRRRRQRSAAPLTGESVGPSTRLRAG
jgi:cytochrome bd-type quinol oxidase subunit 2